MFRVDGSSQFGSNKRWAPFWSVGGGWSMHKEEFMSNLKWVNELKPRILMVFPVTCLVCL